ncbi:MAG: hypothetical protein HOD43_06140 [Candidatus Marinimicrobia bacterium]|nr:hypothetical protein [Candidatus Neomarinimicrobiota bacterium]MBT3631943.1 hypothetical protein [Candidatus Neomarinimicrobiota bacterium]MBT3824024.1 hypothetical protein [Candidatus Neomarinimicrobiota bacterium]MBT4131284.1 hypothetical protein [Candidatus Neomarinimicrobiota bacterium]MBT4295372.1 hypothetical protein [Candidatus Neomarinimicrobiota bacterium]
MNQWLHKVCLLLLGLLMVACEDATIDYSSDVVGVYIVETATVDGIYTDFSALPVEEAWIIDITQNNLLSYFNDINLCDSTFELNAKEIESVTDTSIYFGDNTRMYYSIQAENLVLTSNDDVITLADYGSDFPPASWTNPARLTNDIYEPDSTLDLATRISAAGALQTHYSAVCDDADFFIFEALDSTTYIIEIDAEAGSDIDLTLTLYSAAGSFVVYNDDQSTTDVDPKLEWDCEDSGDYYFMVKKYWDYLDPGNSLDDEKGAYTVSVDVTKTLMKVSPPDLIKLPRPVRSTRLQDRFFD